MKTQTFIYRPAHIEDDKKLIEELTKCLSMLMATTEHYHLHFGGHNKQAMQYWENKSKTLLEQMKQPPIIEPKIF